MQKVYVAAIYPKLNGFYYAVHFLDFDDLRGKNLAPNQIHDTDLVAKNLQQIINDMIKEGRPIPEPKLKTYEYFESSYGSEIYYMDVPVTVPNNKLETRR